jgi:hypothetical protein
MSEDKADELSDDYLSAAAGVVDAARNLDDASKEADELFEQWQTALGKKTKTEKALKDALDKLKGADTGRK